MRPATAGTHLAARIGALVVAAASASVTSADSAASTASTASTASAASAAAAVMAPADSAGGPVSVASTRQSRRLPSYVLPPIEVRADPFPDALGPFPLSSRRIGRRLVEARPGGDLRDVLLSVAGVRVVSAGAPYSSSLSIRGARPDQVLVLVDGRRRTLAQGGGVDLASIPLETVEDVVVFRGGASALWGSDALGGAVHVRTRPPAPGAVRLRLGAGSFGERSIAGTGTLPLAPGWSARLATRVFEAGGDYAFDGRRTGSEKVRNGDVSRLLGDLRIEGDAGNAAVRVDAEARRLERGAPGTEEFPTPTARLTERLASFGARVSRAARKDAPRSLDVSFLRLDKSYREPGAAFGPVEESHRNDRFAAEATIGRSGRRIAASAGAGASEDRLRSSTDGRRTRSAAHVHGRVSHDFRAGRRAARVMFAARADAVEDFAPHLSPRLGGLVELVPERLELRASAGLSYRTPSFDELFWPARATAAGNPDLAPERGRDVDASLRLRGTARDAELLIGGFYRDVRDLIQWAPGASGIWRPHNVGRAHVAGLEVETSFGIALPGRVRARVSGNLTWLDARDDTGEVNVDGRRLVYRPELAGVTGLELSRPGWGELETSWRFVDELFVTRANTKALSGYTLGDVRYRRPIGGGLALDAAVTNVTAAQARDFRHYPLPGRAWNVGLAWERSR